MPAKLVHRPQGVRKSSRQPFSLMGCRPSPRTLTAPTGRGQPWRSIVRRVALCGAGFLRNGKGVQWGKRNCPGSGVNQGSPAPLTRPWPGYPLPGCSPAEPDSVSPGTIHYSQDKGRWRCVCLPLVRTCNERDGASASSHLFCLGRRKGKDLFLGRPGDGAVHRRAVVVVSSGRRLANLDRCFVPTRLALGDRCRAEP